MASFVPSIRSWRRAVSVITTGSVAANCNPSAYFVSQSSKSTLSALRSSRAPPSSGDTARRIFCSAASILSFLSTKEIPVARILSASSNTTERSCHKEGVVSCSVVSSGRLITSKLVCPSAPMNRLAATSLRANLRITISPSIAFIRSTPTTRSGTASTVSDCAPSVGLMMYSPFTSTPKLGKVRKKVRLTDSRLCGHVTTESATWFTIGVRRLGVNTR